VANGAELDNDELPFAAVLARQLNAGYIHVAEDASSIPHLVLQLKTAIDKIPKDNTQPVLATFLLTSLDRDLMWSTTTPKGTGFMESNPPPYNAPELVYLNGHDPLHRDWFLEYHSEELSSYRTNTTILALQQMCRFHNIQDHWAWAWTMENSVQLWPEVDTSRFYLNGKSSMKDSEFDSVKVNRRIGHPDQQQHNLMASRFANLIQQTR